MGGRINVPSRDLGSLPWGAYNSHHPALVYVFAFSVTPNGSSLLRAKTLHLCVPRAWHGADPSEMLPSEAHTVGCHRPWSVPSPHATHWISDNGGPASQLFTAPHSFHLHRSSGCYGPAPHAPRLPMGRPGGSEAPTSWHCRRRVPGCPGLGEGGQHFRVKLSRHTRATPHRGLLGSTYFSRGRRVACLTCFL